MKLMQRWCAALLVALALCGAGPAGAQSKPPEGPGADPALVERRLEAARQRLEQAAQEVAELAAGLVPGTIDDLHVRVGEPRAMLGVQLGDARPGGGVRIVGVSPGGPAAEAGLKPGDAIISVNGHRAAVAADVAEQVRALRPGDEAKLDVDRGSKVEHVVVVTRTLDPRLALLGRGSADWPGIESLGALVEDWHSLLCGGSGELELAALSPELGRYFATDKGVLVIRAPADGSLKLRDGDVVTAIDGREPQGVSHALSILRSYQPGERMTLAIMRDRKPQKIELAMPARPAHEGQHRPRPSAAPPAPSAPAAPAPPATAPAAKPPGAGA